MHVERLSRHLAFPRPVRALAFAFLISASRLSAADHPFPTSVTILHHDQLVGTNVYSVGEAIEALNGIDVEREGYRGSQELVKIRGGRNASSVLVLIDGRPLNPDFDGQVDLSLLPISMVERIEITRGGSSVAYGPEAIGGTINIVTLRPSEKGLTARLGTGVGRDGVKHHHGRLAGRSYLGDLTYATSLEEAGGFQLNGQSKGTNQFGNVSRSFNGKGYAGATYFYSNIRVGLPRGTPAPFDRWDGVAETVALDPESERRQTYQQLGFEAASPPIGDGTLFTNVTWSEHNYGVKNLSDGPLVQDLSHESESAELRWEQRGWRAGGQYRGTRKILYPYGWSGTSLTGAFLTKQFASPSFSATPGIRYDVHNRAGSAVTPRLALAYRLAPDVTVSGSAEHAARFPNLEENASNTSGNTDLDPERAWSGDAGVAWQGFDHIRLALTGFASRSRDVIRLDPATGLYVNEGKGRVNGVEVETTLQAGAGTTFTNVAVTGNWTALESFRTELGSGRYVRAGRTPRRRAFVRLDQYLPLRMTLSNELRYQGQQFDEDDSQGVFIPSYTLWNIRLNIKVLTGDLYVAIENVARRRYADTAGPSPAGPNTLYPQPDRTYWAGLSIRFRN